MSGNVSIHGVSLNGVGITGNTNGILFNSGGSLTVRDSVIRNFGRQWHQFRAELFDPEPALCVEHAGFG